MWKFLQNLVSPVPKHRYTTVELTYFSRNRKLIQKLCQIRQNKESGYVELFTTHNNWIALEKVFTSKKCQKVRKQVDAIFAAQEDQESLDSDDSRQTYPIDVIRPSVSGRWREITSFCFSFNLKESLTDDRNSLMASE